MAEFSGLAGILKRKCGDLKFRYSTDLKFWISTYLQLIPIRERPSIYLWGLS